jgi:hypothetical protein
MKKNKLKVKKSSRGGGMDMGNAANQAQSAAMGNAGSNAGNKNLGDTGPQGSESITSFTDNYASRFKSQGYKNLIPGSQIANTIGAIKDTNMGMKAMGIKNKPLQINNGDNSNTCPPGQRMQNGTCVPAGGTPQATRLFKGGNVEKMLLGGLLTAGIKYGVKRYAKATGKKLIDLAKGQSKKLGKADKVEAIKLYGSTNLHGGAKLSKLEKIKLNYYKDIL